MFRFFALFILGLLGVLAACTLPPRDRIHVVGSSTVYPFTSVAAEQFARGTGFKTPIVESTGTGGGMKMFCSGAGQGYPDMVNASRTIKEKEIQTCQKNGVTEIFEMPVGYDGIVLGQMREAQSFPLTRKQLFLALAKHVPQKREGGGKGLIENPYINWSDISPALPNSKIEIYGPPPTSGTREAFVELVMEKACMDMPAFTEAYPEKNARKKACHLMREDGGFIDAGENDNIIVNKLQNNERALGIFGYSFLEENRSKMKGLTIEGVKPSFEAIADGRYKISRSLYIYAKPQHLVAIPGLGRFLQELTSEQAIGMDGYLAYRGLIPLPESDRMQTREQLQEILQRYRPQ